MATNKNTKMKKNSTANVRRLSINMLTSSTVLLCSACSVNAGAIIQHSKNLATENYTDNNDTQQNSISKAITQSDYDDYVTFIRNAIAAKFNSITSIANKHQAWIRKIIGTFLANVNSYDPTTDSTTSGTVLWTPEKILQEKYEYVQEQATLLGVSSVDFNKMQDDLNNTNVLQREATNDGVSLANTTMLSIAMNNALITAKSQYLDMYGFTLQEAFELSKLGWAPLDNNMYQDKVLQAATSEWGRTLRSNLCLLDDTSDFTNFVKGYSDVGHYVAGDEIQTKDLSYLFSYKYQYSNYGVDFGKYVPDDIDTWKATQPGTYDENILSNLYDIKQFNGFESEDSQIVYKEGEILPGITLHAKIKTLDVDTDSHICSMQLMYGISHTNSDQVLWFDNNSSSGDIDLEKSTVDKLDLKITSTQQLQYIAKNRYYKNDGNQLEYRITVPKDNNATGDGTTDANKFSFRDNYTPTPDDKNNRKDGNAITIFGLDDWKERPFLDDIMEKYCVASGDKYDFSEHPVFVTLGTGYFGGDPIKTKTLSQDYFGIPAPTNAGNFQSFATNIYSDFSSIMHKHQQLALKISDINTNPKYDYLTINWCVVDAINDQNDTVDNSNIKTDDGYKDVYDIPWSITTTDATPVTTTMDTINLFYHINPTTETLIDYGISVGSSIAEMSDTLSMWGKNFRGINWEKINKYYHANDKYDLATASLSLISGVLSAINAGFNILIGGGRNYALWLKVAFATAVATLCAIAEAFQVSQMHGGPNPYATKKEDKHLEGDYNMLKRLDALNVTVTPEWVSMWRDLNKQTSPYLSILQDSHATFSAKKNACVLIDQVWRTTFIGTGSQSQSNRVIFNQMISKQYDMVVNEIDPNVVDPSVQPISKDEYVADVNDALFDKAPSITANMQIDADTAKRLLSLMTTLEGLVNKYTEVLTKDVAAIADRILYYQQNQSMPGLKDHKPSYQWSQVLDWSNSKRVASNLKNLFYLARDVSNCWLETRAGSWSDSRSVMDFYIQIMSKLYPESNVKFIATFIFAKGTDTVFKLIKMVDTWKKGTNQYSDAMTALKCWGKIDPVVQTIRFLGTIASLAAYIAQAVLDTWVYDDPTQ